MWIGLEPFRTCRFDAPTIATLQVDLGRPWTAADQTAVLLGELPMPHRDIGCPVERRARWRNIRALAELTADWSVEYGWQRRPVMRSATRWVWM